MAVVLILILDTHFDAVGVGLMELLDVGVTMRRTRLLERAVVARLMMLQRHRLVMAVAEAAGRIVRRCRRADGVEVLTSRRLIIIVGGTVEEEFLLVLLLLHMKLLQLLL